jgi:hypothetical protein
MERAASVGTADGSCRSTDLRLAPKRRERVPLRRAEIGWPVNCRGARTLSLRGGQGLPIIRAQEGRTSRATPPWQPSPRHRRDGLALRQFSARCIGRPHGALRGTRSRRQTLEFTNSPTHQVTNFLWGPTSRRHDSPTPVRHWPAGPTARRAGHVRAAWRPNSPTCVQHGLPRVCDCAVRH